MHTAEWYRKKAEECVSRAKTATKNEERARNWALAEHYTRLAMDQLIPNTGGDKPARSASAASVQSGRRLGRNGIDHAAGNH
jgi:hypothetical protein